MHQGNWKCSKCGGTITELPFEPRSETGLTCRECYFKDKNGGQAPGAAGGASPSDGDTGSSAAMDEREAPPFDPDAEGGASEPAPPPPDSIDGAVPATGERKMFKGDWKCSGCGAAITQLPFEPRGDANLKCIDCFKNSKN